MIKQCEICKKEFETSSKGGTRKYCFECSPSYEKGNNIARGKSKSALRRAMKKQAVKELGGKCEICGYDKCIDALVFHHKNPDEKEFGLAQNGTIHTWEEYLTEAKKCQLLCCNCHAEEHYRLRQEQDNDIN